VGLRLVMLRCLIFDFSLITRASFDGMKKRLLGLVGVLLLGVLVAYLVGVDDYTAYNGTFQCKNLWDRGIDNSCRAHAINKGLLAGVVVAAIGVAVVLLTTRKPR
jgi:drug/metabolite transporter superfamily protein YnfA